MGPGIVTLGLKPDEQCSGGHAPLPKPTALAFLTAGALPTQAQASLPTGEGLRGSYLRTSPPEPPCPPSGPLLDPHSHEVPKCPPNPPIGCRGPSWVPWAGPPDLPSRKSSKAGLGAGSGHLGAAQVHLLMDFSSHPQVVLKQNGPNLQRPAVSHTGDVLSAAPSP